MAREPWTRTLARDSSLRGPAILLLPAASLLVSSTGHISFQVAFVIAIAVVVLASRRRRAITRADAAAVARREAA